MRKGEKNVLEALRLIEEQFNEGSYGCFGSSERDCSSAEVDPICMACVATQEDGVSAGIEVLVDLKEVQP